MHQWTCLPLNYVTKCDVYLKFIGPSDHHVNCLKPAVCKRLYKKSEKMWLGYARLGLARPGLIRHQLTHAICQNCTYQ